MRTLSLVLLLVGCTSTEIRVDPIDIEHTPPPQPSQVITHKVTWHNDGEKIWLTPQDGVKVNAERKDLIRYIKEVQLISCFYNDSYTFCDKTKPDINDQAESGSL